MSNLIASSATVEGLTKLACNFFYSENIRINEGKIYNSKGIINNFVVIKKGNRYRLEAI